MFSLLPRKLTTEDLVKDFLRRDSSPKRREPSVHWFARRDA